MTKNFMQIAFTESVKKEQERYGSRNAYAKMEKSLDRYVLSDKEVSFRASLKIRIFIREQGSTARKPAQLHGWRR